MEFLLGKVSSNYCKLSGYYIHHSIAVKVHVLKFSFSQNRGRMSSDKSSFRGPHILISYRHILSLVLALLLAPGIFGQQPGEQTPYSLCSTYISDSGSILAAAAVAGGVAIAEKGGRIRLLSGNTLDTVWSAEVGGEVVSNLLAAGDSLYIAVNTASDEPRSRLRILSPETGLIKSTFELASSSSFFLASAGDAVVIVPAGKAPVVFSEGTLSQPGIFGAWAAGDSFLFADKERVILGSSGGSVKIVSLPTGSVIAEKPGSNGKAETAFLSSGGRSVVGTGSGEIRSEANDSNGRSWSFKTGGAVVLLKSLDERIIAASNDNFLYLLSEDSGRVIWRSRLPGRPSTGALLKNNKAAIAVLGEERLLLIDVANGKVLNSVGLESGEEVQLGGIFEGEGGNLLLHTTRGIKAFAAGGGCSKKN